MGESGATKGEIPEGSFRTTDMFEVFEKKSRPKISKKTKKIDDLGSFRTTEMFEVFEKK